MANLPDGSGDAYSNLVQGDGTASLTFTMPGTVPLAVSSVVVTVDNSAGGDTTATLVISDPSGEVIATKRQGVVIPAGDTGTATWALRLDDEVAAAPPPTGGDYVFVAQTNHLATGTPITFSGIPQDARHLELFVMGAGALEIQFNGDTGANYQTIATLMRSLNGVVTTDATTSGVSASIIMPGFGVINLWRATIRIPYYRFSPSSGFSDRSLDATVWEHDDDTITPADDLWKIDFAGFWKYAAWPALPVPAITSIHLGPSGVGLLASLYKIM